MSKDDFLFQVEEGLKTRPEIAGASVSSHVYMKNNDTEYYGVTIFFNPEKISPVFYIDRFYDDYCRKKLTVDETVDKILSTYKTLVADKADHFDLSLNFDDVKDRITYRLVSLKKNKKFLEDVPHIIYLDLAIIFTVVYKLDSGGVESLKITYELMDAWEKKVGELMELAKVNTPRLFPPVLKRLTDVLGMDDYSFDMLLLSNEYYVFGATAILYEDEMCKIAERLDDDLYVIPSSIHEVLILPKCLVCDVDDINDMIHSINEEQLISTDILSDKAYFYDRSENRFYF